MVKTLLQILVVLLIGLPFLYMACDVVYDLTKRMGRQAKPVILNFVAGLIK